MKLDKGPSVGLTGGSWSLQFPTSLGRLGSYNCRDDVASECPESVHILLAVEDIRDRKGWTYLYESRTWTEYLLTSPVSQDHRDISLRTKSFKLIVTVPIAVGLELPNTKARRGDWSPATGIVVTVRVPITS